MTKSNRLLDSIRATADAFGTAQPGDLLRQAGMDRNALVRAIADLAERGLVDIDTESGAVSLTAAGHAERVSEVPTPEPETGLKAQPAGYALAEAATADVGKTEGETVGAPRRRVDRRSKSQGPAMTQAAAAAAVKQVKDTAVAVIRRRAAKTAARPVSRSREMSAGLEPMTIAAKPAVSTKARRPKSVLPKAKAKKPGVKPRTVGPMSPLNQGKNHKAKIKKPAPKRPAARRAGRKK